jgi:hypothetical protein
MQHFEISKQQLCLQRATTTTTASLIRSRAAAANVAVLFVGRERSNPTVENHHSKSRGPHVRRSLITQLDAIIH